MYRKIPDPGSIAEDAVNLLVKAIRAAFSRDVMSGGGTGVAIIGSSGIEERVYPIR